MTRESTKRSQQGTDLREALNRLAEVLSRPSLPPPHLTADVSETPDGTAYILEAAAPGVAPNEITITASGDMLTVEITPRASSEEPARPYLVQEVPRQPMARVFTFPTPIDVDHVEARLAQGILHIRAPKAEGAPSRVIKIAA